MSWPPRFCADCGAPVALLPGATPAARCGRCGMVHYRNAKPCAGVLIERDGKLLLARRGIEPRFGLWNVVGGFLQPDEHPRDAAVREALEETGLRVEILEVVGMYVDRYGDQPGDDYTLNIYFRARCHGRATPRSDVADLRWFHPDNLPPDMAFAHEPALLAAWRALPRLG